MHKLTKSLVFAAILALASVALAEVTLRVAQKIKSGTSLLTMLPEYRERRFQLSPFLVFGPRVNWQIPNKPSPETAYFNSQGFRTRETLGPKAPDEFRIITLGGSTTEDVWNEDGLHWPLWLERELRAAVPGVRVYNSAMSAYTSAHTLIRLEFDVLDYQPDLVIVMENINDLVINYRAAIAGRLPDGHYRTPYAEKEFTGDIDESSVVLSRLAHTIRARLAAAKPHQVVPSDYQIANGLKYFKRNLANIHVVAANSGSNVMFLTMPACEDEDIYRKVELDGRRRFSSPLPSSFDRFRSDFAAYNEAIREVAAGRGVPIVDMHQLLGGDKQWFADVVHYNAAGSRRFGELLSAQVAARVRELLVKSRPPT